MKDRQDKRWTVSIPCTVEWKDWKITGRMANVSLAGALITEANAAPPEGTLVTITLQAEQADVVFKGRIMHTVWETIADARIGSLGVKFEESRDNVREKLIPVLHILISQEDYPMKALKNYLGKNSEQIFALLILVVVPVIFYLVPYKLVFLNIFFIVILLAAYYLEAYKALMGGVLTTLIVVIYAYYFPSSFAPTLSTVDLWMSVLAWSSFLILTAGVVGRLTHRLKTEMEEAKKVRRDLEIYTRTLEEWVARSMHE